MRDWTAFRPRELRVAARALGRSSSGAEVRLGRARSPFGVCTVGTLDGAFVWLSFGEASAIEVASRLACDVRDEGETFARALAETLFSGPRDALALTLIGSPFRLRVWAELLTVPYGATTSYGAIATSLGDPSLARAVGHAVGANPIALLVPCHRVVAASGAIGGYRWGRDRKRELLAAEGAGA